MQRYSKDIQSNQIVLNDQLKYNYAGNQLTSVVDSSNNTSAAFQLPGTTAYGYDVNGNMTSRINTVNTGNNISSISYNYLNLPSTMTAGGNAISYTYDASGIKLRKVVGSSVLNEYIGGIQYEQGVLKYLQTSEGRVVRNSDTDYKYEYTLADHLGNGRLYFDINGSQARKIQETNYYPFGLDIQETIIGIENKYQYNGKEKQDQEKMYDYGARLYDPVIGRFNVIDRFAEKYYTMTPYQYGGNNPISTIDINGDSLWVTHRTGFLGLGGKETLRYEVGNYYNKDGSAYEGKVNGFLKQTSSALSDLSQTDEGGSLVSSLVGSDNNFTIVKGTNSFSASNVIAAGANLTEYQTATGNTRGSTGSGGIISFDPSTTTSSMNTAGNTNRPSYIGLGHEMAHGRDANFGVLHFSNDYTGGTGVTYQSQFMGLKKSEWRAAYYENLIRGQAGVPLRTHYGLSNDVNTGTSQGLGPRLLDVNNRPINYYK
ncbi:M91 family zinc metallopeptidase [Pedobacter gandavensis]|uniref:M91 family zinc metallopeptidase n=1 Tax=Pedobacter gandavensis TaxID=2679963 RepID=UPI002930AAE1|nr:M91 family zinc metallopeptidase [Pedobacter gandavensis]